MWEFESEAPSAKLVTILGLSLMKNTLHTPLADLNYLNWTLQPQPQHATSLPLPLQCHHSFRPCQPPPPCVPSLQEQTENGFSTAGSAVIDDDNPAGFTSSTSAVRREGPLRTLDSHRPITVHFGQVGGNDKGWGCGVEENVKRERVFNGFHSFNVCMYVLVIKII